MPPTNTDDIIELVISELGAALDHDRYPAFAAAARSALAGLDCVGLGVAHRTLAPLQRRFFDPPADVIEAHAGAKHYRPSKLIAAPAIGDDIDGRALRYKKLRTAG
jgi:hypothetical protein